MLDRLGDINLESLSFWIGFITATIFWWLVIRLRPYFKRALIAFKESLIAARQSLQTGAEQRLRANTLKYVQTFHLSSPLFSLDEIAIPPRLMPPPVQFIPGEEPPLDYVTENVIPFMPEFPEISGAYNGHTLSLAEAFFGGVNLIITGKPGSGKTTALAYLASMLSRRDPSLGDMKDFVPIFFHINELDLLEEADNQLLDPLQAVLAGRSSSIRPAQLSEVLKSAFREGRILLLIDGFDEISENTGQTISNYITKILESYPETRVVAAADPRFVDGLVKIGLHPIPLAAWTQRQRAQFIQRWGYLWQQFVIDHSSEETSYIDPVYLNGWLLNDNAALSPLEFTLKVWAVYAGDARGASGMDAIEAYLRRMSVGISKAQSALEYIATQTIFTMQTSFTRGEAQNWTSGFDSNAVEGAGLAMVSDLDADDEPREITIPRVISDLTRNGLLVQRANNRLEIIHPVLVGYLAGRSIALRGNPTSIFAQPAWPIQQLAVHYLAAHADLSDRVAQLLTDTEDPLYRGVLTAGSWLRDIPADADWHKPILQHLSNILQQDLLPISFRGRVLACLVTTGDPGIATIMRHLLRSPKESVVQLAAIGCGFIRDPQSVNDLIKQGVSPTRASQAICLALVNIGTKPALEAAATILLQNEEMLRRAVAEAFAHNPEEGHSILREGSTMDDLLVRRSVLNGLRLVGEPWANQILEEIQVEDGQWVVRNAAQQIVEELNALDPYVPQPLEPLETLPWLVEFAAEQGSGIGDPAKARDMLLKVLRDGSPDQTAAALDIFRLKGDENIFPAIFHLLYGEDQEIAEAAYHTIWQLAANGAAIPAPIQFGLGY
jgi:HEAT repeat protein